MWGAGSFLLLPADVAAGACVQLATGGGWRLPSSSTWPGGTPGGEAGGVLLPSSCFLMTWQQGQAAPLPTGGGWRLPAAVSRRGTPSRLRPPAARRRGEQEEGRRKKGPPPPPGRARPRTRHEVSTPCNHTRTHVEQEVRRPHGRGMLRTEYQPRHTCVPGAPYPTLKPLTYGNGVFPASGTRATRSCFLPGNPAAPLVLPATWTQLGAAAAASTPISSGVMPRIQRTCSAGVVGSRALGGEARQAESASLAEDHRLRTDTGGPAAVLLLAATMAASHGLRSTLARLPKRARGCTPWRATQPPRCRAARKPSAEFLRLHTRSRCSALPIADARPECLDQHIEGCRPWVPPSPLALPPLLSGIAYRRARCACLLPFLCSNCSAR